MTSVEEIRNRIFDLIQKHEPDKVDSVDALMKKWKGKENDLNKTLSEKFGEDYTKIKPVGIKQKYSIGGKVGTGGFAVVRKCKKRGTGTGDKPAEVYALKVINKKNLEKDDLVILESEVAIMRLCNPQTTEQKDNGNYDGSENIVKLHDVFDSRSKMCLVLDLLTGGELFDRIIEQGHFTEAAAAKAFREMCQALQFLHSLNVVHRDLKPENLLFESKEKDAKLKLIDFGLAGSCKAGPLKTPCGTPNYVAPEILRRHPYGVQADMWSAGVILYIILCGFPPFYDEQDDLGRLYRKIKKAEYDMPSPYWDNISDGAKDLVRKLLQPEPKKRLTATQTLNHQWLKGGAAEPKQDDEKYKAWRKQQVFHLKRFQYIRRMRRGVRCILAVLRLIEALQYSQQQQQSQQSKAQAK